MSDREDYRPGHANAARVEKTEGDTWALILVKSLPHSPERVWRALTDPVELAEWSPFDADRDLGVEGAKVRLTTVGAPSEHVTETTIIRADRPRQLQYQWGGGDVRWDLEPENGGTRLTLWAQINRRFIAMGAAGWHVCLDVLESTLDGDPIGRLVAGDALKSAGWQRLNEEYSKQFGVEAIRW